MIMTKPSSISRDEGWVAAGAAIGVWGVTFASTRVLLEDFSSLEINIVRFALAWAALWGWEFCGAMRSSRPTIESRPTIDTNTKKRRYDDELLFAAMGLTGVALYQFLENCAIYYTNANNVAILVSLGPIVTATLARVFSQDRSLSPMLVAGSLVAICGGAMVVFNGVVDFQLRPIGDLMALGAMVSWGLYSVLLDRANRLGIAASCAVRKSFGWALVLMAPLAIWGVTESGYVALDGSCSVTLDPVANIERFTSARNICNIAFLGLLASALSFGLWSFACRSLGVVRATVGLYLTPVVGVVFAVVFLGERFSVMSAVGGVMIALGVVLANWEKGERK